MIRPPSISTAFEQLPLDPDERHEFLIDIFGCQLLWAMKEAIHNSKTLVESSEARQKLGRVPATPYAETATKLGPEEQEVALKLIEATLQRFAKNVLLILESQGIAMKLGKNHAIQFRLTEEIRDIDNMDLQLEDVINRNGKKAFADYWGHWLHQYADLDIL